MEIDKLKDTKNSDGESIYKNFECRNKKPRKGVKFEDINELYKELLTKYKPKDILITAAPLDGGFITLKGKNYVVDNLKYTDTDYMKSVPKEKRDKLTGKYYEVFFQITL